MNTRERLLLPALYPVAEFADLIDEDEDDGELWLGGEPPYRSISTKDCRFAKQIFEYLDKE